MGRDRVKAPFVPGVAATNPFNAESAAFESAVGFDGFFSVARTARLKATGLSEERAEQQAIGFNEIQDYRLHRLTALNQRGCNSGVMVSKAITESGAFATTTKSIAPNMSCCRRKFSLICRFMRLRITAFLLTFLETTRPTRGWPISLFAA
jgi:hypothetical protein